MGYYSSILKRFGMPETLEKIQKIFKESKVFALLSKKNSEDYKLLAKEALKLALSEDKKDFISLPINPVFSKKWNKIISLEEKKIIQKQTSIRIPKNQYKVKELSYEEDENFLSLIITSENGGLEKNNIVFEPILPKIDAAFCFFEPSNDEAFEIFKENVSLPPKEKIVFFTSDERTFAEKISQIIKTTTPEIYSLPQISTLLFASLITETNNFIRPISQETLRFGSDLLSRSADKETIKKILNEEKTVPFAQLLGRALARTHVDDKLNSSWTFLSQKDLEKTENPMPSPLFLYNIMKNLRELIPPQPLSLCFWQDKPISTDITNGNILALVAADEERDLIPVAKQLGVKLQSKFFVAGPFNNFSEAELRLRKALEDIFSLKV